MNQLGLFDLALSDTLEDRARLVEADAARFDRDRAESLRMVKEAKCSATTN